MEQNPQSQLKLLVTRGKEQGYLTYAEVNDHLPEDIVDSDQIEDIIQMINDMGIQVMEEAPDADDLMLAENTADEDAAEAAAQVLSSVESEKTGSTRFNAPLLNIRKRSPICWNSTIVLKQKKRVCPI